MSSTKNIGQVVGLFISTVPPTNTALIWFDKTPNQLCHKVYNPTLGLWQVLDPDIISNTTYSELVNNAKKNGLSIGKQYIIRDKSNVLATVITPTKIQYTDTLGNILIDDLGTNIQYHVTGNNIYIDDVNGVLDSSNHLVFSFLESEPNIDNDFVLGKHRAGTKWILSKFKLSGLLSKLTGNSISWRNGFFFNFSEAIKGILDKSGGVVSKNTFDKKMTSLDKSIENVSKENQNIITNASQAIEDATKDDTIYSKKLPADIDTTVAPGDIQKNDILSIIISKIQRWINQFKYATGIKISMNFADAKSRQWINNNDTVESALSKVQYHLKNTTQGTLPDGFDSYLPPLGSLPTSGDSISLAFKRIKSYIQNLKILLKLSNDWQPFNHEYDVQLPKSGDTIETAFSKAVAKFNQIGSISNGVIESSQRNTSDSPTIQGTPKMKIALNQGIITLRGSGSEEETTTNRKNFSQLTPSQIQIGNEDASGSILNINRGTFEYRGSSSKYYTSGSFLIKNANGTVIPITTAFLSSSATALSAKNSRGYDYNFYDAFFGNMKIGGLIYDAVYLESDYYIGANTSMILCNSNKSEAINVYLPENTETGRIIYVLRGGNGAVNVFARGNNGIDMIGSSASSVGIASRGQIYMFIFNRGISYSNEDTTRSGLWGYSVLPH